MRHKSRWCIGLLSATAVLAALAIPSATANPNRNAAPERADATPVIPRVTVQYAYLPYFDQSQSTIGVSKGWYKQVGITLAPGKQGLVSTGDGAIALFASGRVNIIAGSAQLFMPAVAKLPAFKDFVIGDLFQGYGLMGKKKYKTYGQFKKQGLNSARALKTAISQMKGKVFCFPSEAGVKGFIDLVLLKGGLRLSDVKSTVAPDPQTTALMQAGRCDFQTGGVPSRLTLQLAGFKPVVSSGDLAATARPSANSKELRAIMHDGWVATDSWLAKNHGTALRFVSVSLRINDFIHRSPMAAAKIHTAFLNSIAGTNFKPTLAAKVVYPPQGLDPFLTWPQQLDHCFNNKNPLNVKYETGARIKLYEEQGLFTKNQYTWRNFTNACQLLGELKGLKAQAKKAFPKAKAGPLLTAAKKYYAAFDYLDAARFAKAAARR